MQHSGERETFIQNICHELEVHAPSRKHCFILPYEILILAHLEMLAIESLAGDLPCLRVLNNTSPYMRGHNHVT